MCEGKTLVSKSIIEKWKKADAFVARLVDYLESDEEVAALLEMSNINAVQRLGYNDHGPVHARIVAGTSLEILSMLTRSSVELSSLKHGTARSLDEVKFILVAASYLHDIGNSIHREYHEATGSLLAKDIVDRALRYTFPEMETRRRVFLRQEVLSAIFSTEMNTKPLTVEASIVKLADGLDMSEGRARLSYKLGKIDMHSLSALNVKRVELTCSEQVPIVVEVYMGDMAGFFQVERVLLPKLESSKLKGMVRIDIFDGSGRKVASLT
ncbi:HD domain-containing protein [Thermofilum pendens]|uniref:Metal dependent phosphohydrolase n=1 Tax=Thermofilum pendens (strain DSM 2475 / Hrk 5) TaxID=368408 RepID=A1RWE1_THEPD|nr:HD domain-containing protein [Thermofilum pendens]ABL77521.1 metal dependent phosphohydrolase [Thermofilum pendens Hrk 5]